jgi:hypothetical protein
MAKPRRDSKREDRIRNEVIVDPHLLEIEFRIGLPIERADWRGRFSLRYGMEKPDSGRGFIAVANSS